MKTSTPLHGTGRRIGRFPYDPARLPFFYGWVILIGATLGVLMSAPGQTVGVSVFTDFLIEAHGLSRNLLSLAYLLGTIGSALLLSRVGRAYDRHGGRWLAVGAAVMMSLVLAGFALLAFIIFRARPEDHGLRPDGNLALKTRSTHAETDAGHSFTLAEARRTYSFWVFALSAVLCGLLLTACTFHVVSIFGEAGIGRERAVSVFMPAAFVAVSFEFIGSWLSDYIKLKYLAMVQMTGIVLLSLALAQRQAWRGPQQSRGRRVVGGTFGTAELATDQLCQGLHPDSRPTPPCAI